MNKKIFVACDVSSQKEIIDLISKIHEEISGIKIGLQYITRHSPEDIKELSKFNKPIFYDGKFLTNIKNVNYKVEKENEFKPKQTQELFGALGYLAILNELKKENNDKNHFLTPKMLIRYAPNFMRKDDSDTKLHGKDLFSLDRLDSETNFESGTNLTLGLDYELDSSKNKVGFNIAQIINEKNNRY